MNNNLLSQLECKPVDGRDKSLIYYIALYKLFAQPFYSIEYLLVFSNLEEKTSNSISIIIF